MKFLCGINIKETFLQGNWTESEQSSSSTLSPTFENGADVFPYGDGPGSVELSQCQLHVEERHTTEDGHQNIGNKESPCTDMRGDVTVRWVFS